MSGISVAAAGRQPDRPVETSISMPSRASTGALAVQWQMQAVPREQHVREQPRASPPARDRIARAPAAALRYPGGGPRPYAG